MEPTAANGPFLFPTYYINASDTKEVGQNRMSKGILCYFHFD